MKTYLISPFPMNLNYFLLYYTIRPGLTNGPQSSRISKLPLSVPHFKFAGIMSPRGTSL